MARTIGLVAKEKETPAETFLCPVCGKEYKTAEGLEKHIKEKHPDNQN